MSETRDERRTLLRRAVDAFVAYEVRRWDPADLEAIEEVEALRAGLRVAVDLFREMKVRDDDITRLEARVRHLRADYSALDTLRRVQPRIDELLAADRGELARHRAEAIDRADRAADLEAVAVWADRLGCEGQARDHRARAAELRRTRVLP